MSEWIETSIGNLVTLQRGHDLVQTEFIKGQYLVAGSNGPIGEHNNFTTKGPGLTIGRSGNSIGSAHYYEHDFWAHNTVLYSKTFHSAHPKFIYYLFKSLDLKSFDGGSAVPTLNRNHVHLMKVRVPKRVNEQKSISDILSSIEEKIELLLSQNRVIEQLAQTIFRQWFVEEAAENWETATLAEHTEVFRGLSYKGSGLTNAENGLPMHNLNSVYEFGGYKRDGIKYYKGDYRERHLVTAGDIIVTNTEQGHEYRLIGFPGVIPNSFGKAGLFSQHIYRLIPNRETFLTNHFLYYLLMIPSMREQIIGATNGSTVNMLAIDGLQRPDFKLPPKQKVLEFSKIVADYWKKKESNHDQIEILTKLRDILLPKLVSGEVKVISNTK